MDNLGGSKVSTKAISQQPLQSDAAWTNLRHGLDSWTADLVDQYRGLGLSNTEATRFLQVVYAALGSVLEGIDRHALAAAPIPEQVSMLLPRFDIAHLARTTGIATAQAQSAVAMLVLEFVMHAHPLF